MKKLTFAILTSLIILFFGLSCRESENDLKPPRGYPNETFLKAAYVTGLLKLIDTRPAVPEELQVYEGIEYKKAGNLSLKLDIYRKKDLNKKAPVIIFVHGGGWKKGKRSDYLPYLVDYAMKGYVTATVSYRLTDVAKFPDPVDDVKCAIKWIKDNAENYGIDPNRVALLGGSAGGHLVLMAGYDNSDVQAIVDFYGPVDLTTPYARERTESLGFLGKTYKEAPELYRAASPKTYITPDDPPTLIFHGTLDSLVPVSQADSLDVWLTKAGVEHEYHRLKGWPHTMDMAKKVNKYCQHYIDAFLKAHL